MIRNIITLNEAHLREGRENGASCTHNCIAHSDMAIDGEFSLNIFPDADSTRCHLRDPEIATGVAVAAGTGGALKGES